MIRRAEFKGFNCMLIYVIIMIVLTKRQGFVQADSKLDIYVNSSREIIAYKTEIITTLLDINLNRSFWSNINLNITLVASLFLDNGRKVVGLGWACTSDSIVVPSLVTTLLMRISRKECGAIFKLYSCCIISFVNPSFYSVIIVPEPITASH